MSVVSLRFFNMVLVFLLTGCAAVGVPATSDPGEKLKWADALMDVSRPIPAERLIREAIEIYQTQGNQSGLAEAYRTYGVFFRDDVVTKWQYHYQRAGFFDKAATYEFRYKKSIEYLVLADKIYAALDDLTARSNVHLNMGFTYRIAGDNSAACKAYSESLALHRAARQRDPGLVVQLPAKYKTYEEALEPYLKSATCDQFGDMSK